MTDTNIFEILCPNGVCPVVQAVSEIRGSGIFVDPDEDNSPHGGHDDSVCPRNVIRVGGKDVYADEMSFYIMTRKIDLARFELSNPTLVRAIAKAKSMFGHIPHSKLDVYIHIIDTAMKKKYVYSYLTRLCAIINSIEAMIETKLALIARAGAIINISLPGAVPIVDIAVMYKPDVLAQTANSIINYMNKLNINNILREPVTISIPHVPAFTVNDEVSNGVIIGQISPISARSRDEYLREMKRFLGEELLIAWYISEIELYHCSVINHLADIFDVCDRITATIIDPKK